METLGKGSLVSRLAVTLLAAVLLSGCQQFRLSDITAKPGIPAVSVSPTMVSAGELVNVTVTTSARVVETLPQSELAFENQTGLCVYTGRVAYEDRSTLECVNQAALPDGVSLNAESSLDSFVTTVAAPGQVKTFTHQATLKFTVSGTYTVFGRQVIYGVPGNKNTVSTRLISPQAQIVTVN